MSLLKGHVHPIDVDVAEHAVVAGVETVVAGDAESLVTSADDEL